ncbi:MAG: hypothetical protein AB7P99_02335 [Vicinamibacterales bacterium]
MAVFQAVADESDGPDQQGAFLFGGFVAPAQDWNNWFDPAWEDRVIKRKPVIPYFHMVEMRSPSWRAAIGLGSAEAESRIDEAARVIGSSGSLHLVRTQLDGGVFREVFKATKVVRTGHQPGWYPLEPDYLGFLGFAYGALEWVADNYPDAETVDFLVERKSKVTHRIGDFHKTLGDALREKGKPHLVRLIGSLNSGEKNRVPLQAADMAMWHLRRLATGTCDQRDLVRLGWMFDGRRITENGMTAEEISAFAERSKKNRVAGPFTPKRKRAIGGASPESENQADGQA